MLRSLVVAVALLPALARAAEHPFLLWDARDVAAIRKRIEVEPWARRELEELRSTKGSGVVHANLLRAVVLGEDGPAQVELTHLLSFVDAPVDPRTWSDNYLHALRYDCLYERLSAPQRAGVERTFRAHVTWYLGHDRDKPDPVRWLPNMHYPRTIGIHLMAVALRDERLIRACFDSTTGLRYYFAEYLADGFLYREEFGKHYALIGQFLLWHRGVTRLGLGDLSPANLRRHVESTHLLAYPRVDLGTDRPHYPKMTLGDARGGPRAFPGYAFQHSLVTGYLADGATGGNPRFFASNMNGRDHADREVEKHLAPLWFELAHHYWPDARLDYFLAQMRRPDQDRYYPSLFFDADPVDPAKVTPPAAPSGVYRERGVAMLRFDESPAYWASPAPAVGLRLATRYAHDVPDCFALTGLYAFNRPIYLNRQASSGYAGTDPAWSNSVRSHCAVIVDGLEPTPVGLVPTRQAFQPLVKYVAATARGVYPDVTQTRALFLTKEYLFDLSHLHGPAARSYVWQVHTLGHLTPDNPQDFAPTRYLLGTLPDLVDERSWVANDRGWSVTAVQASAGADPSRKLLGDRWFEDRIGVRVTMLGEPGQVAFTAVSPVTAGKKDRLNHGADEPGGATIAASRGAATATFAALHEPFKGRPAIHSFRRLQQVDDAIAVAVTGRGVDDRILFRWGNDHDRLVTLGGPGESFTFSDRAYLRIATDRIDACGDLRGLTLRVAGSPKLFLNGKEQPTSVVDGVLSFGPPTKGDDVPGVVAVPPLPEGPVAARFARPLLRLPLGGRGVATLHLRNNGFTPLTMKLQFDAPDGVTLKPDSITLSAFEPGEEQSHPIEVSLAAGTLPNQLFNVTLVPGEGGAIPLQEAKLKVSHGVATESPQHFPNDPAVTIHAPAYVAKYYVQQSAAAALLLDPSGRRRFPTDGDVFPTVVTRDAAGRTTRATPGPYAYFSPRLKDGAFHEPGEHAHGARSPFEYRFTERWIEVRMKQPPPDAVSFDWWPEASFERTLAARADGAVAALERGDRKEQPIVALFRRPPDQSYGVATFYPEGASLRAGVPVHPGGAWMAFTFCREDEFAALVEAWRSRGR